MPDPLMDTLDEIDRKSGTFLLSHLVLCYIVLPLFMNPHKGKNKGRNQLRKHCF